MNKGEERKKGGRENGEEKESLKISKKNKIIIKK